MHREKGEGLSRATDPRHLRQTRKRLGTARCQPARADENKSPFIGNGAPLASPHPRAGLPHQHPTASLNGKSGFQPCPGRQAANDKAPPGRRAREGLSAPRWVSVSGLARDDAKLAEAD